MSLEAKEKKVMLTTIPELTWLAQEIAPESLQIHSLLKSGVNAHYVDAKPSFIMKLRKADMLCMVGLGLEGAWINRALEKSMNKELLKKENKCQLGSAIKVIGKATKSFDRSHGHLHAEGNPHFWYASGAMIDAVGYLQKKIKYLAPESVLEIDQKTQKLIEKLSQLKEKWLGIFQDKKMSVAQYHSDYDYYLQELQLKRIQNVETKPGVPPSLKDLKAFQDAALENKLNAILAFPWDPKELLHSLSKKVNAELILWPSDEVNFLKAYEQFSKELLNSIK